MIRKKINLILLACFPFYLQAMEENKTPKAAQKVSLVPAQHSKRSLQQWCIKNLIKHGLLDSSIEKLDSTNKNVTDLLKRERYFETCKKGDHKQILAAIRTIPNSGFSHITIEDMALLVFFSNDNINSNQVRTSLTYLMSKFNKNTENKFTNRIFDTFLSSSFYQESPPSNLKRRLRVIEYDKNPFLYKKALQYRLKKLEITNPILNEAFKILYNDDEKVSIKPDVKWEDVFADIIKKQSPDK